MDAREKNETDNKRERQILPQADHESGQELELRMSPTGKADTIRAQENGRAARRVRSQLAREQILRWMLSEVNSREASSTMVFFENVPWR